MYLRFLSHEAKFLFLELSLHMANADLSFTDDEKLMIAGLCDEMDIPVSFTSTISLEKAIRKLADISSERTKKMILFELGGVIMSDGLYDKAEEELLHRIADQVGIDSDFITNSMDCVCDMFKIYRRVSNLIGME